MTNCRIGNITFKNGTQLRIIDRENAGTWQSSNPAGIVTIRNHEGPISIERGIFLLDAAMEQFKQQAVDAIDPPTRGR